MDTPVRNTEALNGSTLWGNPSATSPHTLDEDAKSEGAQTTYTDKSFDDYLGDVPSDLLKAGKACLYYWHATTD